jgi:hypothetical protein
LCPIKKYSWIIDNYQDKLLSSPRETPTPSINQDRLVSAPRIPSNIASTLEAQIDSIKESCEFVINFCNDYESMKRYVEYMEGVEPK